jgi:hypothetical protein
MASAMPDIKISAESIMPKGKVHYLPSGKIYPSFMPTHKAGEGRLMTGLTHTAKSQYLTHKKPK